MPPNRLPIVDSDDGVWGDILRQYLMQEHVNDDTDNPQNGGHKTITIQPGTASAGTAPLKFSSGTLLTTPEAGAIEFLTDTLYFTDSSGPTRRAIATYPVSGGAEGDIYYRNSSGAFTRLGVGNNGEVLTVSSGVPAWSSTGVADKLDSADFTNKARGGANLAVNGDFEDTTVARTNYGNPISPGYSTEQARSGTNSWKWTTPTLGNTSGLQFDLSDGNISTNVTARVQSGDKFYISAWIYAHASNSHGAGGAIQLIARFSDSKGVLSNSFQSETINLSSLSVSTWTKLHVSLDTPNGYDRLVVYITANNAVPQNNIYYVDDLVWQSVSTYRQGAELELFNTKDEETNYEKARHYWNSNTYTIATENGGSGSARAMSLSANGRVLTMGNASNAWLDFSSNTTVAIPQMRLAGSWGHTSGTSTGLSIAPTINQSSTAGYTALLVNPTHTTTGSGAKLLADFQLGGVSMASISTAGVISAAAGTASSNVVTVGGAQTLTNKTLTNARINQLNDVNGNTSLVFGATASAVNHVQIFNHASGSSPYLKAAGSDANVSLSLAPKGTGVISLRGDDFSHVLIAASVTGAANYIRIDNSLTGSAPTVQAAGTDTNIALNLAAKGSGTVQANGVEVATISGTQTLTNKTINASNNTLSNIAVSHFAASAIVTEGEGIASNDNDTTIPTSAAVKDYVDVTLSPTFQDNTFTLQDNGDTSKQARFELSGITASTTRTFTLPDANTTLVGTGTVQTLTNKTLTSPRVNNILDTNGATILNFSATASADNYLTVANGNATWVGLQANGASTNIPIYMYPKGNGALVVYTSTGNTPTIQANGQDTNLNLNLTSKGTGTVQANGVDVVTTTGTQTLTNKTLTTPQIDSIRDTVANSTVATFASVSGGGDYWRFYNHNAGLINMQAAGASTNIGIRFNPKGSGVFQVYADTGQTPTILASGADSNRNLNLTTSGTGVVQANGVEVATVSSTQTLTNKTLTGVYLNHARVNDFLDYNYGRTVIAFSSSSDAVNLIRVEATSASASPVIRALGDDTNIDLNLNSKGSGVVKADGVEVTTISGTQTLTNKTINASNNTLSNIAISHMASSAIVTESEGINSSDNDTSVPTTAAVKDYVDAKPPLTWTEVTGTSQTASVNRGYITNNAGLVTVTLPTTAAVGDTVKITGKGAGGWRLAQNSGETIHFGNQDTTTGASGRLDSTHRYDCVELVCVTADNDWVVVSSVGNINIT